MTKYLPLIHRIVVSLFLLIYLLKTILLLINKHEALKIFTKVVKIPEMIISLLFLMTGIWLMVNLPVISALLIIKVCVVLVSIPVAIVGFKKKSKIMASLSLLMIIGGYGIAEMSKKRREKPIEAKNIESTDAKGIYNSACANCHGKDGKAGLSGAFDLSKTSLNHENIYNVILNGRASMPAYKNIYTAEQIE
ncbi:MAG: c-type cytochrome, partial [Bacteroidota bacterium]